jgi:protein-disulfide isomerase
MKKSIFIKLVIIGIAALMISSFFAGYTLRANMGSMMQTPLQASQLPTTVPVNVSSIPLNGAPIKGRLDAPVTLVEYSDFQCPFCQRFFSNTLPQIQSEFVDKGKLKFAYKEFPVEELHPNSPAASLAAKCAYEEGKFWEYHDVLFGNQTRWENLGVDDAAKAFKKYAADLRLNSVNFNSCFDSKKDQNKVNSDSQEGISYGVNGTPTFYIGNDKKGYIRVEGSQPFSSFKQIIEQKLRS